MPFAVTNNFYGSGFVGAGTRPMPDPNGSEVVSIRCTAIVNGTGAINDVIPLAKLPAGCIVVDWQVDNDDLDTGAATLTADFGVIVAGAVSAAAANGGKWQTATAILAAPAVTIGHHQTAAIATALARMTADVADRSLGFVVTVAGNAAAAANAQVGLILYYRASYANN
jgi:hypothetical protein